MATNSPYSEIPNLVRPRPLLCCRPVLNCPALLHALAVRRYSLGVDFCVLYCLYVTHSPISHSRTAKREFYARATPKVK